MKDLYWNPGISEKCDVTLLWYQNFWIKTVGSLSNDDRDGNEKIIIAIGLDQKNNNFARALLFVLHSLAVVTRLRHEASNFTRLLYGVDKHDTKFSSSFSKLRYCPFEFNARKFCQHFTKSMKFENIGDFETV